MAMMVAMSPVADDDWLEVWIWYPGWDEDYSKSETVDLWLKEHKPSVADSRKTNR